MNDNVQDASMNDSLNDIEETPVVVEETPAVVETNMVHCPWCAKEYYRQNQGDINFIVQKIQIK